MIVRFLQRDTIRLTKTIVLCFNQNFLCNASQRWCRCHNKRVIFLVASLFYSLWCRIPWASLHESKITSFTRTRLIHVASSYPDTYRHSFPVAKQLSISNFPVFSMDSFSNHVLWCWNIITYILMCDVIRTRDRSHICRILCIPKLGHSWYALFDLMSSVDVNLLPPDIHAAAYNKQACIQTRRLTYEQTDGSIPLCIYLFTRAIVLMFGNVVKPF